MEFKIDTKDAFTIIMPDTDKISAKMAEEVEKECEILRQSGSRNFIIDLQCCKMIDGEAIKVIIAMHEELYGQEQSLVFTGINESVMAVIKSNEADLLINIAPRMDEAVDIISMEILERDLLGEEG
jgi:anti-anti-sigma regulatory factor